MMRHETYFCFDLDGTLFDHDSAVKDGVEDFRNHISDFHTIDPHEFYVKWQELSEKYMDLYLEKRLSFSEQRIQRVQELFLSYGISIRAEQAERYFEIFLERYEANWRLFADVEETLEALGRDHSLGMITNGNSEQQRKKYDHFQLDRFFHTVIISGEVGASKPDRAIFDHYTTTVGTTPEKCFYVGDKLKIDALAASEAGLKGVWLNRKNSEKNDRVQTIHSLSELLLKDE